MKVKIKIAILSLMVLTISCNNNRPDYSDSVNFNILRELRSKISTDSICKAPKGDKKQTIINIYTQILEEGRKAAIHTLSDKGEYEDMFRWEKVKEIDPTTKKEITVERAVDLINEKDIAKRLKKFKEMYINDGGFAYFDARTKLSDADINQIAKEYIDGTLDVDYDQFTLLGAQKRSESRFMWKGQEIIIPDINGVYPAFPYRTQKYKENIQKINERIPIPKFEAGLGAVYPQSIFLSTKRALINKIANESEYYHGMFRWEKVKEIDENGTEVIREKAVDLINENDIYKRLKKFDIEKDPGLLSLDQRVNLSDIKLHQIAAAYVDGVLNVEYDEYDAFGNYKPESVFEWEGEKYKIKNKVSFSLDVPAFPYRTQQYLKLLRKIKVLFLINWDWEAISEA